MYNYYDPIAQGMQQRFNTARMMSPSYAPTYTQAYQQLKGRIVTSIDEARASQIDLDGSPSFFPSPSENKIYVKYLNLDGVPEFVVYTLDKRVNTNSRADELNRLESRIARLESLYNKEVNINESVPIDANATKCE